ncbi:MAG: YfhO family protein [Flavobacteriales bacterium]
MQKINFKNALPHLLGLAIFLLVTVIYFQPLFQGKKVYQGDIVNFIGMSQELKEFRAETGEEALWTNRMFSGMPAYQISYNTPSNLTHYADKVMSFNFPRQASFVLLAFIGFYILLITMGISPAFAIVGALGYGLTTYLFIIIEAGHNTKAHAMAYVAPVIAGVLLAYKGKFLKGAALTSLFLALQFKANHVQISYYLLMMLILLAVFEFASAYKRDELKQFFKATLFLLFAAVLGIGSNIEKLWSTIDYGKYSTRSQSELTIDGDQENKTSGLNKDYATSWSYGKMETFNLMIPNFMGGASGSPLTKDSETYKVLKKRNVPNAKNVIKRMPTYWGAQPFTSGPVYIGAIMCFLFVLGAFLVKGKLKWWLLSCTLLSFTLAWGNNMMWLTDFFLEYVPGYNKFRTVSMILVIAELTIPLLGFVAIKQIIENKFENQELIKSLKYSIGITAGLCLLFAFVGSSLFNFSSAADTQYPDFLVSALEVDRASLMRSDSLRSLVFILLAACSIYLYHLKKIKLMPFAILLGVLVLADMLPVNNRYLNSEDFVKAKKMDTPFQKTAADIEILKDKELNFRVYNTTERIDAGARTSYFHNNLGGYHGAKLKRYQELIDMQIAKGNSSVIDMLNTKYIIRKGSSGAMLALKNPSQLGAAWFVSSAKVVNNADDEMTALSTFNPSSEVLIDKRYNLEERTYNATGSINLSSYKPNHLVYDVTAEDESFAVFSEIFYDKGWNAYVDGVLKDHYRVNYVLRGMPLPKGAYSVEFKFEPQSVALGSSIALVCSTLIYLLLASMFYFSMNKRKRSTFN